MIRKYGKIELFHLITEKNQRALFSDPAFIVSVITKFILVWNTKASSVVNGVIVFIKMAILLLFVVIGATKIDLSDFWVL